MTIGKEKQGGTLTIALKGSLDSQTAPDLEEELNTCLDGAAELVFDFSGLDYISSAGLRAMVGAYKRMETRGSMRIIHASDMIKEIFEVVGLNESFEIR